VLKDKFIYDYSLIDLGEKIMLLDKILLNQLGLIGESLLQKAGLEKAPTSVEEMSRFLYSVKTSIQNESFDGLLVGNIFFSFVTDKEVRDRKVTSRIFEDIFSGLFSLIPTDKKSRKNPVSIRDIMDLDVFCNEDWLISTDLSGNKREKTDVHLGDYEVSLKTLKGKVYNDKGVIIDKSFNGELNVGSLSYRALLKGILEDEQILKLKDRKGGLGSAGQIRLNMLNPILNLNKRADFLKRLSLFMHYVYSDDVFIVLKSHYKIKFILIPAECLCKSIIKLYDERENEFENVWYRWENNNLRFRWVPMLDYMSEFNLDYKEIDINLSKAIANKKVKNFLNKITKSVSDNLKDLV
jgi:hypothetical protein